jgi:hypothetical protein
MASSTVETSRRPKTAAPSDGGVATGAERRDVTAAAHQAFWLLRIAFTVAPVLFGVDKFFNWTVHWPHYLAG